MLAAIIGPPLTKLEPKALRRAVQKARSEQEGETDQAKAAVKPLAELPGHDLQQLVDEARATSDTELHAALRALVDGHELVRRWPDDHVARTVLLDALDEVIDVADAAA
jgi:hypothetical protein